MESRILMPRLGVNDDYVTLTKWLVTNGSPVNKGQKIAVIETTKETSEISADVDGHINFKVQENEDIAVDSVIAIISDKQGISVTESRDSLEQYKLTVKAKALIEQYNLDISQLPKEGLIKEKDVIKLIHKPFELTESKSNHILIYGGGGFCKIAIDILRTEPTWQIYGIVDIYYLEKKNVLDVPVIGADAQLQELLDNGYRKIFNAVGFKDKAHWRKPPFEMLQEMGFEFVNVIHRNAIIETSVKMGQGNLICAGAIIGTETRIGSNCIINAGAVISHDCIISDHSHIASGAVLAGNVTVGENTLIGQNCTVYSDVKIGKNVVIQNGCHIFKDIRDGEIVLLGAEK